MKRLDILVVFDSAGTPPEDQDFTEEFKKDEWLTESAVVETLTSMGHSVRTLGIYDDIGLLLKNVADNPPDIVFNLTEVFMGKAHLDKSIPALLEAMDIPYTGCCADGLVLCNNKALTKEILTYHRIKVPRFYSFRKGKRIWLPSRLQLPLVVKPLREEASTGISQASHVASMQQLNERITFIHQSLDMNAIAEQYIHGRELYVSVLGNRRLWAFPPREMQFQNVPEGEPRLATYKAKWDVKYREKWGIKNHIPSDIPEPVLRKIRNTCKRAYRALHLDGYARFDCRLTKENDIYIIEANANPELAQGDDFAESAEKGGFPYGRLLTKLLAMGLTRE